MASIEVRGYVNRPAAKTSSKGGYSMFTLAAKQKVRNRDTKQLEDQKVYFSCIDFKNAEPPEDGAYVTVKGFFTATGWVKDGKGGANLDIAVQELEVAPPRDAGDAYVSKKTHSPPADPFALNDEAPF